MKRPGDLRLASELASVELGGFSVRRVACRWCGPLGDHHALDFREASLQPRGRFRPIGPADVLHHTIQDRPGRALPLYLRRVRPEEPQVGPLGIAGAEYTTG